MSGSAPLINEVREKDCKCESGASGPRWVFEKLRNERNTGFLKMRATWVLLACDQCSRPWRLHRAALDQPET